MPVQKPALDPQSLEALSRSVYPEPYRSRVLPREVRALGDALGLTRIGINMARLLPGRESSMRHWHTREDEFVYILEGELVLRTDGGEQVLRAGMRRLCRRLRGRTSVHQSQQPAGHLPRGQQPRSGGYGALCGSGRGPRVESCARALADDAPRRHALVMSCAQCAAAVRRSAKDTLTSLPT